MWDMLKRLILGVPDERQEVTQSRLEAALEENRNVTMRANTQIFDNIEHSQSTVEVVQTMLHRMENRRHEDHQ